MASYNIELNNRPVKGTNYYTLLLRITIDRKHSRVSLPYSILKKQFNPNGKKSNYVRASNPNHKKINHYIDDQIELCKDIVSARMKKKKPVSAQLIKDELIKPKTSSFVDFSNNHYNRLIKQKNISTAEKYKAGLATLLDFVQSDDIQFADIDLQFLSDYEDHLKEQGKASTTIHGKIKNIKALFNKAIQQGVITPSQSPFLVYKLKQGQPNKDRLNLEEIIKIEELELTPGTLISHVRNVFLFSFYNAGIRISDSLMLTWENIQNGRLVYTMYKTNRVHSLLLKDKPLAILNQYRTDETQKEDYIFPFFKNHIDYSDPLFLHNQIGSKTALINKYLKQIATKAEIDKNITTHTARHSFADIARKKEKNIYNLSKALGHSSIKVTEAYLASFDEAAIDETLNNVFD